MKLSFVIPTYNAVTWLPATVKSAQDQTMKDIEIIIVDDGSTDHTFQYLDWLKNQGDSRIKIERLETNIGRSAARNHGNRLAGGDLIMVLDADDIATPNRAELTWAKHKHSSAEFIYGTATVMDCFGHIIGRWQADVFNKAKSFESGLNYIVHSSVAYTKRVALEIPYEESGEISKLGLDDWHQQVRVALAGVKMDYVPQPLCSYRELESAVTKVRDQKRVGEVKKAFFDSLKVAA